MFAVSRRKKMVKLIHQEGRASVTQLAERFEISEVTVRSDLKALHSAGLVARAWGGAVALNQSYRELSLLEKQGRNRLVKQRLAEHVRRSIHEGDSIILDAGSTTAAVAAGLSHYKNLTIMTNGLNVANALLEAPDVEVLLTGGQLRRASMSFYGVQAERSLEHYNFGKLIMSADGVDPERGITTHFDRDASLNRKMCSAVNEIILVVDSSKFGLLNPFSVCKIQNINRIVTDNRIDNYFIEQIEDANVKLEIVDVDNSELDHGE